MTRPNKKALVGYLVNQYPKGSHTFVRREIHALEALGTEVLRFSVRRTREAMSDPQDAREGEITRAILDAGFLVVLISTLHALFRAPLAFVQTVLKAIRLGRRSEKGRLFQLVYLLEACVLGRWLRAQGVSHVHAHFGTNSATVAMLCASVWGVSYSFTIHGPEEFDKAPLLSLDEKVAGARFVAVISSFGRSQLYRHCDSKHWDKIVVVPCGLDSGFLDEAPTPVSADGGLVCVGRLSEQKGHAILCHAIERLAQEGSPCHVTFIGDGELRPMIEELVRARDLAGQVSLAGWKDGDGVKAALRASRALVLPSFAEGLPVVIMEAMALGRPVITTYVAGIPELVRDGVNGWLVPASDVGQLAAAMKAAMQASPDDLSRMGQDGRARVHARHDIRDSARLLAALFNAEAPTTAQVGAIFQAHVSSAKSDT